MASAMLLREALAGSITMPRDGCASRNMKSALIVEAKRIMFREGVIRRRISIFMYVVRMIESGRVYYTEILTHRRNTSCFCYLGFGFARELLRGT